MIDLQINHGLPRCVRPCHEPLGEMQLQLQAGEQPPPKSSDHVGQNWPPTEREDQVDTLPGEGSESWESKETNC